MEGEIHMKIWFKNKNKLKWLSSIQIKFIADCKGKKIWYSAVNYCIFFCVFWQKGWMVWTTLVLISCMHITTCCNKLLSVLKAELTVYPSSLDYRSEHLLQLALEKDTCIVMCPEFSSHICLSVQIMYIPFVLSI
jgi:hypothetical protein